MKVNDTVKCKNASGSEFLVHNLEYILVDQNQHGNWRVKEKELGYLSTHWYKPERFIVVKEKVIPTISISKKYTTRDGREVKLYVTNGAEEEYPVVGVVKDGNSWTNQTWAANGVWLDGIQDVRDLVEVVTEATLEFGSLKVDVSHNGVVRFVYNNASQIVMSKDDFDKVIEARAKLLK
jgi:hypothetical protein